MRISIILIIFLFFNSFFLTFSQDTIQPGKIEVIKDSKVDVLLDKHLKYCRNNPYLHGYRIQIYFDSGNNSKKGAINAKAKFITKYPDVEAYIIFQEPYYKVRVGDFRTRIEAEGFLGKIIDEYPNAYRVNDNINFPELR